MNSPIHPAPPALKGTLPFRLGTTSYIIPDDILPNLVHLRNQVDDVELLLFESDEISNLPGAETTEEIARLGRESNLSFTVHLPLDTHLGSADEACRRGSVAKCRRIVDRMTPIEPFAWVLHLHGDQRGDPPTTDLPRWIDRNRRSLAEFLDGGPASRKVCVEILDYDFELVADLVREFDLSVCLDVGHLLANRRDVTAHLDRWLDRARVFHVHGVAPDGKDHSDLSHLPPGLAEDLAKRLARLPPGDERVVTMEVFGAEDFSRSLQTVAERWKPWRKSS